MATLLEALAQLSPDDQARISATLRAGDLMTAMLKDPDASPHIQRLADKTAKKLDPAHLTVEDQAKPFVDQVMAEVDRRFKERDEGNAKTSAEKTMEAWVAARKAEGFTDEGISNIAKIMQRGVANPDDALKIYRMDNPANEEAATGNPNYYWNVGGEMQRGDNKDFFFPQTGIPIAQEGMTPSQGQGQAEAWARETALSYLTGRTALPAG